jgi:hypothetical protein
MESPTMMLGDGSEIISSGEASGKVAVLLVLVMEEADAVSVVEAGELVELVVRVREGVTTVVAT